MSLRNKILLYKTVLKPILLYGSQIWSLVAYFNLQIIEANQNKALKSISKFPWYIKNDTIHRDLKINPIMSSIRKFSTKLFENLHAIHNQNF